MYEKFYGLSEKPFRIVPNPNFLYLTAKHQNALTTLEYGVSEGIGFTLLTGDIGTGKTTLIRYLLNEIEATMDIAVIFNTNVSADQLLNLILQEFELTPDRDNKARTLDTLYQFLIKRFAAGRKVLLIIDEAQNLSLDALEEVRMLSNLQSDEHLLLNIMLVGQPELRIKLQQPGLTQFSQRIAVNYHLTGLDREETDHYIGSRLAKVGGRPEIFSQKAVDRIHQAAAGIPRAINQICDAALVYGFADGQKIIDTEIIEQVLADRGEMGLTGATLAEASQAITEPAGGVPQEVRQRLQGLEETVARLQAKLVLLNDAVEKKIDQYRDDTSQRFQELLIQERKRSDSLLSGYSKLNQKYWALQWLRDKDRKKAKPVPAAEEVDLDFGGAGEEEGTE
ncbi:MAG: hypothetical protein AUK28_11080 [Desulfobacterales bacterium CG2_30_60_27]|nr:MAG: hypothetical protein AUK28_11080 [Desulfobacterales bacterium CG2_30_60_27]